MGSEQSTRSHSTASPVGAPVRVGLRLDLQKPELVAALGPDGSLPATQTFTPVYAHPKPKTPRFGGVAADSNVQFHYLLDRFELR